MRMLLINLKLTYLKYWMLGQMKDFTRVKCTIKKTPPISPSKDKGAIISIQKGAKVSKSFRVREKY